MISKEIPMVKDMFREYDICRLFSVEAKEQIDQEGGLPFYASTYRKISNIENISIGHKC